MGNKVLSITKKEPREATLTDGSYAGRWCAYVITVKYKGVDYELTTESGIRGMCNVVVNIKDGIATFKEIKN